MKRHSTICLAWGLCCMVPALLSNQVYGQDFEFQVITTDEFSEVTASNAGVVYVGPTASGEAIFFFDGTNSQEIVQTGDPAPQGFSDDGSLVNDGNFTIFEDIFRSNSVLSLTDAGHIGFTTVEALANTTRSVTMPTTSGSFLYDGSSVVSISRQSQSPFDAASGANFPAGAAAPVGGFGISATTIGPVYNNVGQAIFSGNLVVRDSVGNATLSGVAVSIGDGTSAGSFTVARNGQELTGVPGITDPTLALTRPVSVQLNDAGLALFQGNISGTDNLTDQVLSVNNLNDTALITTSDGINFDVIARQGDPLPSGTGRFEDGLGNNIDIFRSVSLNNAGQVLFQISEGFFAYDPGTEEVRELFNGTTTVPNSSANIAAGEIDSFGEVIAASVTPLTDSGLFAFSANLNVDTGDSIRDVQIDRGIYVADINSGEITQVAREGQVFGEDPTDFFGAVTNIGARTGISLSEGALGDFSDLSINEAGQVLFAADNIGISVLDASNVNNDPESGVFLFDPTEGLIEVIRGGAPFAEDVLARDRNPNVLTEFSLDDSGRIVFEFELEDGTEGLAFATPTRTIGCNPNSLGDATGDGVVQFDDFVALSTNFGQSATSHTQGDFNCDGRVQFDDFVILSTNFGRTEERDGEANGAAESVPEPNSFALLGIAALFAGRFRRRQITPDNAAV